MPEGKNNNQAIIQWSTFTTNNIVIVIVRAIRQRAARPSTLITQKHSPKINHGDITIVIVLAIRQRAA